VTLRPFLLALLLGMAACAGRPATQADCAALLDRLVELELAERGLHDAVLAERWKADARRRFAAELAACPGLSLPADALPCAATVERSGQLIQRCLR
jgi:hypothetical protein